MPVRLADYEDLLPASHLMHKAFINGPILGEYLHPYRTQHPDDVYLYFLRNLREAWAAGIPDEAVLVSYDTSSDGKDIITGAATWHRKRASPLSHSWSQTLRMRAMETYNYLESLVYPNRAIEPSRATLRQDLEPFIKHHWTGHRVEVWSLELIAVDPSAGRKGYGRELVVWGFEQAKREGVGCSVVAARGVEGFYRGCGFDVEVGNMKDRGGDAIPLAKANIGGGTIMFWDNGRQV